MNLKMAGIDFTRADIDIRQRFSFTRKAIAESMEQCRQREEIQGCVFLSTCNRMELWLSLVEGAQFVLPDFLCSLKGLCADHYREYFVIRENEEAVEHLFFLSAGMKSQIVGEDQILTQVKEALVFAREQEGTDQVLEMLFRRAVTAGKQVKTNVTMDKANYSAAHQAVAFLKRKGSKFAHKTCLVIGNGEMGKLTAQTLREEGADVTVTVRQYRSGMVQIPQGAKRIDYGDRYQYIPICDFVFSATASPNLTITRENLEACRKHQIEQKQACEVQSDQIEQKQVWETQNLQSVCGKSIKEKQIFVDLAVPRDMEPTIAKIEGVSYYDMDSLPVEMQSQEMHSQYKKAKHILRQEIQSFFDWYQCRDLVPKIQGIGANTAAELVWLMGKYLKEINLPDADKENLQKYLEETAGKVVNKLLFELRDQMGPESIRKIVEILE